MNKGNNSGNDDFSFSTGGDELFPLDVDKNKKEPKAPKGVKGYLKNVAKSVVNLGVKTGKTMYPAAFELAEKFKPDETSTVDPKEKVNGFISEVKKYTDISKDLIGSTIKDAKEAVKTGKFVKSEKERENAEEMFGDMFGDDGFDFDGDAASYSDDGSDSSFDLSDSDSGETGATLNTGVAVVKTSYANARINANLAEKTNATIIGASQTQIKSDRVMFAQNLEISQEQHRQKMLMMTNIATNVGKIIEQGNISIRAQMEFSAKQLAFSQDLAAMVKEVRDAQWKLTKTNEKNNKTPKSKFQKIFGNGKVGGLDFKEFGKNFLDNSKSEVAGGFLDSIDMIKEQIDMAMDMGGTNTLKDLATDMIFESAIDKLTNKRSKYGKNSLNKKIEGLPGAINRKLGSIEKNGSPALENLIKKLPFGLGNKLLESNAINLKELAGWAHVDSDIRVKSGRFDMDPSEVHPFDNAAHKALTEVIPWQLAKIDSGINRTEQEYFDYKHNRWQKVSSVSKKLQSAKKDVLEYTEGYDTITNNLNSSIAEGKTGIDLNSALKQVYKEFATNSLFTSGTRNKTWNKDSISKLNSIKQTATEFIINNEDKFMHNIFMLLSDDTDLNDIFATLLDPESDDFDKLFVGIPALPEDVTEKDLGLFLFTALRETPEDVLRDMQIDAASYKNKLTQENFDAEENMFASGAGLVYDATVQADIDSENRNSLVKQRKQLETKKKHIEAAIANGTSKLEFINSSPEKELRKVKEELSNLNDKEANLSENESYSTTGIVNIHAPEDADKFIISDLKDSSTHGLINNIYNLLLSGLDVYVKKPNGKQGELHNEIINRTLGLNGEISIKEEAFKEAKLKLSKSNNTSGFIKLSGPYDTKIAGHKVFVFDKLTLKYVLYKDCSKIDNETGSYIGHLTEKDFEGKELFIKLSDLKRDSAFGARNAAEEKKEREAEFAEDEKNFNSKWYSKIPGAKAVYKLFNGGTQAINNIGNKFLGENFYSERGDFQRIDENSEYYKNIMTDEERKKYEELKKKYEEAPDNAKTAAKNELDKFTDTIKNSKLGKAANSVKNSFKFGANIVASAYNRSDLSVANKALGNKLSKITVNNKTLGQFIAETKNNELLNKINNAESVDEQIQIIRELGTDQSKKFADEAQKKYNENKTKFDEAFKEQGEDGLLHFSLEKTKKTISDKIYSGLVAAEDKILRGELANLKNDKGKKLKECLADINSGELNSKLNATHDPAEQCKILLESHNKELDSFKPKIEEFRAKILEEKEQGGGSIKGVLSVMSSKLLNTVKEKIGGRIAAMNQNRILSKDLLAIKDKESGKTLGEVIAEINDPVLIENLNSAKTVDEKINVLMAYDNPLLNSMKKDIITFKKSIKGRDNSFGGLIIWHKDRAKKKMDNFIKNTLVKKLKKLKVGDKTLGEVLEEISASDPSFKDKIESFTTMTDLAEFLLKSDDERIKPFKKGIRELKDKHMDDEAQGGAAGIIGMGLVAGFDAIKKGMDKIKEFFNKNKKDANSEIDDINKYVHKDIIKLFGGNEQTMRIMDSLGIDVEEAFKDNNHHKASEQIAVILKCNETKKALTRDQKRALKGLMNVEVEKETTNASISNIKNKLTAINNSYETELKKYGDGMSKEEKEQLKNIRDEDTEKESKKLEKAEKKRTKIQKKLDKITSEDNDDVEGNSAKEQREEKRKSKEEKNRISDEKKKLGLFATLVDTLKGWKKDGFKLDKDTTENMKDAVAEGASKGSNEGWTGKVSKFMDDTGLSNTKIGSGIKGALNSAGAIGKGLKSAKDFASGTKVGSKVLGFFGKVGRTASTAGSLGGITGLAGGSAALTGGGMLKGLTTILEKVFKLPQIAAHLGKTGAKAIIDGIKKGAKKVMTKILPKCITLNGMATNFVGWALVAGNAVTSFIRGMSNAKSTFNIGRGLRPTLGMRLACGAAAAVDGVLLGIPGIICKACGFKNAEEWFYSLIGSDAEKAALKRYEEYNKMRATIFGIDNPQSLIDYENRNLEKGGNFFDNLGSGAKRVGRAILNKVTFGIANNNDEKDSKLLGFQSVDIFRYWRDHKFKPLSEEIITNTLEDIKSKHSDDQVIANMDTKKLKAYVERTNAIDSATIDADGNGEVDDTQYAQEEAKALEIQNEYRKLYLENCRKYVTDNKLAWLTTHCTIEKFNARNGEGKSANADMSTKDRVKRAAKIAVTGPIGAIVRATRRIGDLKKQGTITESEAKSIKKLGLIALTGPIGLGVAAVAAGTKKLWKERKHIGRAAANLFRKGMLKDAIEVPYNAMEKVKDLKSFDSTKKVRKDFVKKIIEIAEKYGESHIDQWKEFLGKCDKYNPNIDAYIGKRMAETFTKCACDKYLDQNGIEVDMIKSTLGVEVDKAHPNYDQIRAASGMIGWIMEYYPDLDSMCQSIQGISIKRLAVQIIVNGVKMAKSKSNYEKYMAKRATIFGADQKKLASYEAGLAGGDKTTGWGRFKAGFKAFFSKKDSDELDSQRIGFESVEIYKYWKEHKYTPLINLEKQIAGRYGSYTELIDQHCDDVEAQNKFISEFIKSATKFVDDNQLAWLTTKTTLKEFNEMKKNGFQSAATIASEQAARRSELQSKIASSKEGSKEQKNLQKQLNDLDSMDVGSINSSNNFDFKKDLNALDADLKKGYDEAGLNAHESASEAIHNLWSDIDPTFYNDNALPKENTSTPGENGGPFDELSGALGTHGDNTKVIKEKVFENLKSSKTKSTTAAKKEKDYFTSNENTKATIKHKKTEEELSAPIPLAEKNESGSVNPNESNITKFITGFKSELINKLNILDEIKAEQMRHNKVSEDFYTAMLTMMSMVAKQQGDTRMSSQLDAMVKQVTK